MSTELSEDLRALVGERVHGLDPAGIVVLLEPPAENGFAFPRTTTLLRGQELVLSEQILLASIDRKGGSIWALDEYQQRDRWNGSPRWGFGPYPDSEREYDALNLLQETGTKYVNESTTIANYRGDSDSRRLQASLRSEW